MPLSKFLKENPRLLYQVETVAKVVTNEKPFFKMKSAGVYAVALRDGTPSHVVRVDKDRRPRRIRKRARRMELTAEKAVVESGL